MRSRVFGACAGVGVLSFLASLAAITAGADEKPSASKKPDSSHDLSSFPKLQGKVTQVLGHEGGYAPPQAGEPFQLDLKDVTKLTKLTFDPLKKSYFPLPGPVVVESIHYYSNGGFESMRLIAKKESESVTIDVVPKPGLRPKRVLVWVIRQSEVIQGVALMECEFEGAFPDRVR